MARRFARLSLLARWTRSALKGLLRGTTRREREVNIILCPLPRKIRKALAPWLIAPTDPRWPLPNTFSRHLWPFTPGELRQPARPVPALLVGEMSQMRQTLDRSLDLLSGFSRERRLVTHGTRLRQIVEALGEERALEVIEARLRQTSAERVGPASFLSQRWGGRWAAYFAGAAGG